MGSPRNVYPNYTVIKHNLYYLNVFYRYIIHFLSFLIVIDVLIGTKSLFYFYEIIFTKIKPNKFQTTTINNNKILSLILY